MTHVWGLASPSDPVRPLTYQDEQLIGWLNTDAKFSGFDTYCGTCPQVHSGYGVRPVCCRFESKSMPSRWTRLRRRFSK